MTAEVAIEFTESNVTTAINQTNDRPASGHQYQDGLQNTSTTNVILQPEGSKSELAATIAGYRASKTLEGNIHAPDNTSRTLASRQ
ncbi:hypothetical protein DIJ64_01140 [Mycobacterium leprae]|uniref:Uncharacterized protein n=1 Tax=Mycobacterium leprae TaxID=1769 RepID=A0AAD0KTM1_MYCLR|nr:hypothetical protein DIJ64_01140 [Mycobacterium leprae]